MMTIFLMCLPLTRPAAVAATKLELSILITTAINTPDGRSAASSLTIASLRDAAIENDSTDYSSGSWLRAKLCPVTLS